MAATELARVEQPAGESPCMAGGRAAPDLHPGKVQGYYGHYLYSHTRSVQGMSGRCMG